MGKKKNAKKGGGEDFFDEFGESVPANNGTAPASDDEAPVAPRKNAFAAMSLDDDSNDNTDEKGEAGNASKAQDDDDDQFGGLMSAIKKSNTTSSKKDKKKKKKQQDDDIWDELGEDVSGNAKAPENDKVDAMDVDANQDVSTPAKNEDDGGKDSKQIDKAAPEADAEDDDADDGAPRIMTKKEKERLKKEKEKAKKKAQAAAKKAADGGASTQTPAPPAEESSKTDVKTAENDAEDSGGEEEGATAADKKKKKKKKGAQSKPEPAAAPSGKKPSAAIQALQARMAAQRKAEEEARLAEEEARQREEEAERLEKEEAERKEADRLRRKEKEKAKREQLKREGKLLTPKQKAEKAAAEARMQAMIKTGQIKVDALANRENRDEGEEKERPRKVIDSRKKKGKGPSGPPSKLSAALPEQPKVEETEITEPAKEANLAPSEPVSAEPEAPSKDEAAAEDEDVKDSWDVASDEDVKDEWDAESDEDEKPKDKTEKAAAVSGQANGKPTSAAKADGKTSSSKAPSAAPARASAKGKDADSSSEEDDDSDDDDEDDDDDSDSDDSDDDDDDELTTAQRMAAQRRAEAEQRKKEKHEAALAARSKDNLRSPICCIMGHVDTGKTKLLDKVRQTNVQEGEAGGITQQIGATYFPVDVLKQKIAPIDPDNKQAYNAPGLLILDTPGHASFTNMRTRGSSLCNIAILVVDIMHGLEPQTLESIRLLRDRKTPFVVALNKIDRLYGWQSSPDSAFRNTLAKQNRATQNEFQDRVDKTIVAFAEQGLNAVLYYDNKNFARNVSLVPTSAHTGEGIPDMLQLIVNLTQERMSEKLMYLSELECSVLEVKTEEGLGTTIDVILSNGVMNEGERIVLCGMNGPIVTQVRALLTPQPLKEMRIKGKYVHNKQVKAALGVKIVAPDLEKAISGSRLMVIGEDDDEEDLKEEVMSDLTGLLHSIDKSGRGVCVQASTIGSLEALLDFLKESKIPVNGINIGPVYKRDVMRCATMLEKAPDLAVMLCFDVTIDKDAERLAEELGVTIFSARIIYHLFDNFTAHQKRVLENKQKEKADVAVWPCRLKILAVFAKRSPLILGCEIVSGDLRLGTPIGVKNKETGELVNLGRVTSLEVNHKRLDVVTARTAGAGVAVRIECAAHETPKSYGRHFTDSDELFSLITRQSIDTLKNLFWDNVNIEQKKTIKYLKGVLGIP